jgi:hypothetical protein
LIPNRHWGGEGLLGCVFGSVSLIRLAKLSHLLKSVVSFGLLHRIPPQPEDRVPGTIPAELEEQAEEYEDQDLFVPADTELQEDHHSPSQLAEWRRREQEQWNHEIQARSATRTSGPPLSTTDTLSMTDELAQQFVPETGNHAKPTRNRTSLDHDASRMKMVAS